MRAQIATTNKVEPSTIPAMAPEQQSVGHDSHVSPMLSVQVPSPHTTF